LQPNPNPRSSRQDLGFFAETARFTGDARASASSPKIKSQKINLKSWRIFRPPEINHQFTTFYHASTTHLPSIHHTKTRKNPHITEQNRPLPRQKKIPLNTPAILPVS
jgi:hypothetical protein